MKPTCNCYHSKLTVPTGYTDRSCMHWVSGIQVRSYPVWFFPSLVLLKWPFSSLPKLRLLSCYYHHPIIEVCLSLHLYVLMEALRYHLVSCKLAIQNGTSSFAPTCCCCFANWLLGCWNFVVAETWVGPHSCSIQFPQCLIPVWRSLAPEATFLQYGTFLVKADCISSSQMVIFFMENPQVYLMVPWN